MSGRSEAEEPPQASDAWGWHPGGGSKDEEHPGIAAGGAVVRCWVGVASAIAAMLLCGCAQPQVPSEQERVRQQRVEMLQRRAEATALAREAGAKLDAGEHRRAQSLLEEALGKDPYNFAAHNNLGVLHLKQRRYYEAARAFEEASKLEPSLALPYYNLGRLLEQTYRWEQAAQQYEQALARQPDFLPAIEQLAQCYMRLSRQPQKVKELLDLAVELEHRPEWLEWLTVQRAAAETGLPVGSVTGGAQQ